jgi:hypothetical protein
MNFPRIGYATRVKLGVLLLLVLTALLNNLFFVRLTRSASSPFGQDYVSPADERFASLKTDLPAHGVVGYTSDETDVNERTKKYYLAQYALAPLIVVNNTDQTLVIGDFNKEEAAVIGNLVLLKRFENGVVLFRQPEK